MMKRLMMRAPEPPAGNLIYRVYIAIKDFHSHKYMYDVDSLTGLFEEVGFKEVQTCGFLKSQIEGIEEVEKPERVLNSQGICIEGIKPMEAE